MRLFHLSSRKSVQLKKYFSTKSFYTSSCIYLHNITPYEEINKLLTYFVQGTEQIFRENLVGIYLAGSLSYGYFNINRSDLDLVTVLIKPAVAQDIKQLELLYKEIENDYSTWGSRIECSHITVDMLSSGYPTKITRPYYNNTTFYHKAPYGNEWIIEKYLLYEYGLTIVGKPFREITTPVNVLDVQKACIKDLFEEWVPKTDNSEILNDSHYQSYMVLNLCRILYTIMQQPTGSKIVAASWIKNEIGQHYRDLIETAEQWQYGKEMVYNNEIISFTKFVVEQILSNPTSMALISLPNCILKKNLTDIGLQEKIKISKLIKYSSNDANSNEKLEVPIFGDHDIHNHSSR
jgi:hypothetical protein